MGGCASRPKDLDTNEPAPVQEPVVEKTEPEVVAQENNGDVETKNEEPLVDLSEPAGETKETAESKPAEVTETVTEVKTEEKVEAVAEEKAEATVEAEPKVEAALAEVVAASEPEKTPEAEPVKDEAKPVEAQN